jgi:hypothetical protein
MREEVGDPMRAPLLTVDVQHAVALAAAIAKPRPALGWCSALHMRPEAFSESQVHVEFLQK